MKVSLSTGFVSSALLVCAAFTLVFGSLDPDTRGVLEDQGHATRRLSSSSTPTASHSDEQRGLFTSKTTKLANLLGSRDDAATAFHVLKLDQMLPVTESGVLHEELAAKFMSSPELQVWYQHVTEIEEKNKRFAAFNFLREALGGEAFARMIQLKSKERFDWWSASLRLARDLEKTQFDNWFTKEHVSHNAVEQPEKTVAAIAKRYAQYVRDHRSKEGRYLPE
ncbi:unnamed protein product [Hyaloperonospora brassicae]|uniref:RxLR effector candidate protein n=1 Tax=Hyaloperonospora brassicae TaxID=162125 RepID=A0AAV0U5I4_HYABA|nr:unnamed protein product [Hyaloperonospora brassicae]